MQEYPVVKMKELRNYKIGNVVRLKETEDLVVIDSSESFSCFRCALYYVDDCQDKSGCDGKVHFCPVEDYL